MLYGRDAERAEIGALLDAARDSRSAALVLRGEPGIGKTALLEDARERAPDMHVLSARGIESEAELPFAGLHQLVRPALHLIDRLPGPQANALRGALGLVDRPGDERFLISAACLTLLSEFADRRPVLCLIDDAQWLDRSSGASLLFVARRLNAEGIVMLFAAREGDVRGFDAADVPSILLEELGAEAADALLSTVAGEAAPGVRSRLLEHTRGNALALVELPSALTHAQLAGEEQLPEVLPLTGEVEAIFLERVRRLPEETQRALLLAAADDAEDAALVARAVEGLGIARYPLDAAEQIGLIAVHGQRLEFRHPLVRSAVYGAATWSERREAHAALAAALDREEDADRRAWHLAASVLDTDESVVPALDEAAARAERRGGYLAAAKALVRAGELCSDTAARGSRLVGATRCARIGGADEHAVELAHQAAALVDDPLSRAEIACAIGRAEVHRGRPLDGLPMMMQAAAEVAQLDRRMALDLVVWANSAAWEGGDLGARQELARVAGSLASVASGDDATDAERALAAFATAVAYPGTRSDDLDDAMAWASSADETQHVFAVGVAALVSGEPERAAHLMNRAIAGARARGQLGLLADALIQRAIQHWITQRLDDAVQEAHETTQLARELGYANMLAAAHSILTLVAAVRGDEEDARSYAAQVLEVATANRLPPRAAVAVYGLGMLELGLGHWEDAFARFEVVTNPRPDVGDPLMSKLALPDLIEAGARAGRVDDARHALSSLEEWAGTMDAPWLGFQVAGCRAMLADGEAAEQFDEALALVRDARPFDLARCRLLYGEHLRRGRRRTEARVQLREALELFERLRARPWAERARAELRASGEVARKRDPSTIDDLTPQEVQIARFVADGLSNKEVAAQLFLSPRTIDYHLRNVFAKLGIRSRTQLARLSLGGDEAVGDLTAAASS